MIKDECKYLETLKYIESDLIRKVGHCTMMLNDENKNQPMYKWQQEREQEKLDAVQWALSELKTKL